MEGLPEWKQERKLEGLKNNLKCEQTMLKLISKTFHTKSRKPAQESAGLSDEKSVKGTLEDDENKAEKQNELFCISFYCWKYLEEW